MTLMINSGYTIHYTAKQLLARRGVDINIIKSDSPYVLAETGKPDVVIHKEAFCIDNSYPSIKFCGPNCAFPNYNYVPEIGYSELNIDKTPSSSFRDEIVLVNTMGNMALIKYLESLGPKLIIYGKPCNSLYYYGPLEVDSYALYKEAAYITVDNEPEALKALFTRRINKSGQTILSSFNYNGCVNFRDRDKAQQFNVSDSFLESKNWNNIFDKLFASIGINNG